MIVSLLPVLPGLQVCMSLQLRLVAKVMLRNVANVSAHNTFTVIRIIMLIVHLMPTVMIVFSLRSLPSRASVPCYLWMCCQIKRSIISIYSNKFCRNTTTGNIK